MRLLGSFQKQERIIAEQGEAGTLYFKEVRVKKIIDYTVVIGFDNWKIFLEQVRINLGRGWQPWQGIVIIRDKERERDVYYQVMVKYEEEE